MRPISSTISSSSGRLESRPRVAHLTTTRWGLLVAALLLSGIGLATVQSATSELTIDYLPRQALWVAVGVVLLFVVFAINYQVLMGLSAAIYGASLVSLVLVLFVGQTGGGAQMFLGIGGFRLQPSEFAKVATALFLARYLAGVNQRHVGIRQVLVAGLIIFVPMALVVLESDLGSAAMFGPMLVGALVVSGIRWRTIAASSVIVVVAGALVWNFAMHDYQRQRVRTFVSPEEDPLGAGYQVRQSKIAVGSGKILGKGYMQGTQSQLRFLPARHTDFVFAVLAEEWGFLGVATVFALYALYFSNGMRVAARARDRAGILLVVALLSTFGFHVLYNTAMVVGLVPVTGIPLPFLSYGGSFTLANFIAAGLILGVDFRRYVNR